MASLQGMTLIYREEVGMKLPATNLMQRERPLNGSGGGGGCGETLLSDVLKLQVS